MKASTVALWLTGALVALALVPTIWVLGREALRRRWTKAALARVAAASRLADDTVDVTELVKSLRERFDKLTIERAVLEMLKSTDESKRGTGSRLFAELGMVEDYAKRLREARKWSERTHAAEILGLAAVPTAAHALAEALNDRYEDDASVKVAAAAALAKLRDPSAIPLLVKELLATDDRSSRNVAEALTAFGALAVPPLLELLVDPSHPSARVWAARILGRIGDKRAADDLVARLHDRDDLLRMATAEALGSLGDPRSIQPLVRATLRDPAPQVRAHAAGAVARIEGDRAIDVLVAALADPDYGTRLRALEAFETIRVEDTSHLESALRDPNAEVRRRAALALERVGYLEKTIGRLTSEDRKTSERAYAGIVELGRVGLVDSVAAYIHHERFEVRALVARACGELGIARIATLLLARLDDPAWPARAAMAEAVGRLKPEGGVEALVKMLTDAEEPVREAAAEGLTNFAEKAFEPHVPALVAAYDAGTVPMRTHMVVLLGRLQGEAPDALLVRAARDPSDTVRLRAVAALAGRSGELIVEPLVARLTDASLEIRMAAVAALGSAATTDAFEGLLRALPGAAPDVRDRVAEALSRGARTQLFARLDELEKSPSVDVQIGVTWTLGKCGDVAGVPTLARFLRDKNAALRASAAGALAKISDSTSREALLTAAEDPDGRVRAAVVNALGRAPAGDSRVVAALEGRTRDPDKFVRNRALVALARVERAGIESRIDELGNGADVPARLVALALIGTEKALGPVLDALVEPGTFKTIVSFLSREDPAVRASFFAAVHLVDPSTNDVIEGNIDSLVSQYETVLRTSLDAAARRLAVEAFARLRGGRTAEVLADALVADPAEAVRLQAAEALRSRNDEAVARKALARAVADPSADVALSAVRGLVGRREPEVAAALAGRLGAGTAEVQDAVEQALADLHRADPYPFLDWMMGVDVPEQLIPAVRVLGRAGSPDTLPLLEQLSHSHSAGVRAATVRALGSLPVASAAAIVDRMAEDPNEEVRIAVLETIVWSGDALMRTSPLRRDPSVRVRARLAASLDRFDGPAAKTALKIVEGLLRDGSPVVRAAALATLIASPDVEGLRSFAREWPEATLDTRAELRSEARGPAIADKLAIRLSSTTEAAVRKTALVAIGALAVDGFQKHVLPVLRDPSPEVRIAAIQALASVDDSTVRARLNEMLSDPDLTVRDAARRSMLRTVR